MVGKLIEDPGILIGDGERIAIDSITDEQFVSATEIDSLLEPLHDFWQKLEIHCVAGCCGLDAYSFLPQDILKHIDSNKVEPDRQALERLRENIQRIQSEVIVSWKMNFNLKTSVFLELLDHIIGVLKQIK